VDIFFVISGYVITSSLANHRSESCGDFFLGFYARRVKRLVPALVVFVVTILTIASLFIPKEPPLEFNSYLRTGATALIGLSNLYLFKQSTNYFASSTEYNVFTHTWSLGVEEQFYLLFPFLIWLSGFGRTTGKGERNLFWTTLILSIGSLASFIYLYSVNQSAAYFLMPPRIWELGAGCLIFLALQHRRRLLGRMKELPLSLIAGALIAALFIPLSHAVLATIAVVSLTVCLLACLRPEKVGYGLFTHPQIVYLGLISYSLYLWHWGILCISRWTIGIQWWSWPFQVALMLIIAAISYRYIEMPLRKINKPFNSSHVIGAGMLASLGSALFLLTMGRIERVNLFLGRNVQDINFGEIPSELNRQGAALKIVVLGNSYAHHLLPLVSRISETFNLSYLIKATSSKPIPSVNGDWQLISSSTRDERLQIPNSSLSLSDKNSVDATYMPTIDKEASEALAILKPKDILILSSRHFGLYASPFVHNGSTYYLTAKGDKGEHLSTQTLLRAPRKINNTLDSGMIPIMIY
jgi:peptidoglycan/LPS O-acetylase OafA/YrhL